MLLFNLLIAPLLIHLSSANSPNFRLKAKLRDTNPFKCPLDDIARTGCTGAKDCVYPHPQDYTSYIKCVVDGPDGQQGTPTIQRCAPGLNWNQNTKECDALAKVTRSEGVNRCPGGSLWDNDTEECTGLGNPTPSTDLHRCPSGFLWNNDSKDCERLRKSKRSVNDDGSQPAPFVCPVEEIIESGCAAQNNCYFADLYSGCRAFHACVPSSDGETYTLDTYTCPPGLLFNKEIKSCDFPSKVTCGSSQVGFPLGAAEDEKFNSDDVPHEFECPVEEIKASGCQPRNDCFFPDLYSSCRSFYMCVLTPDGETYSHFQFTCPGDLLFDNDAKTCDFPGLIKCESTQAQASSSKLLTLDSGAPLPETRKGGGQQQVLGAGFECPAKDGSHCPKKEDCKYPHPEDCEKYYTCEVNSDGWTRTAVLGSCPREMWFSVETQECNSKDAVACNNAPGY